MQERKKNIKGLVGGPLLVGGLGPGPPESPLNPAIICRPALLVFHENGGVSTLVIATLKIIL